MLKSENIIINTSNQKPESFDKICGFVRYLAWNEEHKNLLKKWNKMAEIIHNNGMPFCDLEKVELKDLISVSGLDVQAFIQTRKDLKTVQVTMDNLAKKGFDKTAYNGLNSTDKAFLTLQAHTAVKRLQVDTSVLVKADGEKFDFSPLIKKWIDKGEKMSDLKKGLATAFTNMVKEEGELFYPVKFKNSCFPDSYVRNFLGAFTGKTGRDGKDHKGKYVYLNNISDKTVLAAVTDLFAVLLESDSITVVKGGEK